MKRISTFGNATMAVVWPWGWAMVGMLLASPTSTLAADSTHVSSPSSDRIHASLQATDAESQALDRWILERGGPQTLAAFRRGIELIREVNIQGLNQVEDALRWEANSPVFAPLFIRYTGWIRAWHAYDREGKFLTRLAEEYPNAPQIQAAVAFRRAAIQRVQLLQAGREEIERALQQDPQNMLARMLRATLMAQTPWEAKTAKVEFAEIQQASQAQPALANLIEFYRQQGQLATQEMEARAEMSQPIRLVGYPSEKLDWQIKDIAPQAWEAMQRTAGAETWVTGNPLVPLEVALATNAADATNFGVIFSRYLELAEAQGETLRAVALCQNLANKQPKSAHVRAALGYALAAAQGQAVMAQGLGQIDQALARDPDNFFIRTVRMIHLLSTPRAAHQAVNALNQIRETGQFQLAALDAALAQADTFAGKRIFTNSPSSRTPSTQ